MTRSEIAVGSKFGNWTTLERVPGNSRSPPKWVCRCSCGGVKTVDQDNLVRGKTRSCGCSKPPSASITHGRSHDPLLGVWRNMISRCTKPEHDSYPDYGGRGIKVHPAWLKFEVFAQAVGPHPGGGLTFDRENNDGNYEPGNVRWASRAEQARNHRRNQRVEFRGVTQCLQDWATQCGVTANHLYRRHRKGMTWTEAIQDVIDNPPRAKLFGGTPQ